MYHETFTMLSSMRLVEILATLTGILYVVLMTRETRASWVFGNISVTLVSISCYEAGLYADMVLQWIYFVIGIVGFVHWRRGKDAGKHLRISMANGRVRVLSAASVLVVWTIVHLLLTRFHGARSPFLDSLLFAASVVATWHQARKYLDNWLIWIPVNLAYAGLYMERGLPMYSVLSLVFAALSIRGWRAWTSAMHRYEGEHDTTVQRNNP
ncbi:MAG: nicotinamide riboside transporter PnuC [Candidatus Kapaibacterium sp.]